MPIVSFHPYHRDSRAAKLQNSLIKPHSSGPGAEALLVCASAEIEAQILDVAGGRARIGRLNETAAKKFTAGFLFPAGVPADIRTLLEILDAHLTLNARSDVDIAMSLDWHKAENASGALINTQTGQWIQYTKYAPYPNGSSSREARRNLIRSFAAFIKAHPIYASSDFVTAPPGHLADGKSFGELLAQDVARAAGKPFVPMQASGPRKELKSGETGQIDLSGQFSMSMRVHGRVLIVDDVYHSGATMDAAATTCRVAGASEVLVLTATRALRR